MKCSESWLREWVNPKVSREVLCADLTMAGLEVEGCEGDTIDISITPNRGDCLSIRGMSREVSALTKTTTNEIEIPSIKPSHEDSFPIQVYATAACPRYIGRIIRGVNAGAVTPDWLKAKLEHCGLNSISPIVDVTNYVMLELGQPMHAFDLQSISKQINVRLSKKGEKISLLDGSEKVLDDHTLVIADAEKSLAIAGVMGGLNSCVTLTTQDVLLESAFFSPEVVARQRQYYGLSSDSAYRFERGVDFTIQEQAIERATQLILEIAGGRAGELLKQVSESDLPKQKTILLETAAIEKMLGVSIPESDIEAILKALNFQLTRTGVGYSIIVPSYRFDIAIQEDLVEEIARLYGYDKIPARPLRAVLQAVKSSDGALDLSSLRQKLSDQGYQEIITYSFVDETLQSRLNPAELATALLNPITAEMAVMRTNLWPGLIDTLSYNKNRQQNNLRLFEIGTCFTGQGGSVEQLKVAGLMTGLCYPEQWGTPPREVDFYDLKGSVENLISRATYQRESHPALHPGQTAGIYNEGKRIGLLGALHPEIMQDLGISGRVFIFELDVKGLLVPDPQRSHELSRFPEIRRDIAILIKQTIPAQEIQDTIRSVAGDWLKDVFVFDVYQGKGIVPGLRSMAIALILQHPTRTLVDDEVTELMSKVMTTLNGKFGAELRS